MDRRKFLRGALMGGIAATVTGCGGGGGSSGGSSTTAAAAVTPTPAAPAPAPTPTPPPVPTLNGVTIDQAEQDIRSLYSSDLNWVAAQRQYSTDVTVSSPAEFQAAVNAAFDTGANAAVASLNHRIQLAWNGVASLPGLPDARITVGKVFSTASHFKSGGSVTIVAAPGFKPAFANTVFIGAQGVIVQGVGFVRAPAAGELAAAINAVLLMQGASFPMEPVAHFQDCYFGHADGFGTMANFASNAVAVPESTQVACGVATQGLSQFLSFADCRFWGTLNAAKLVSRSVRIDGCDFSHMNLDAITLYGHTFATGYTAAAWITRSTFRDRIDTWANRSLHVDAIQYCAPMDIHQGIRLLVTDCAFHLAHSFAGDPGMGGGTQGMHGGNNPNMDNQFVVRRVTCMTTAPHGFAYYSPKATRPSFVDQSTFFRAGRTPSGFAPDTQPQQDYVIGITGAAGNVPATGEWLLVTDTISANQYTSTGAKIDTVLVDPRNGAAADLRPENVFVGRDFTRGGAAANNLAGKFAYDLPNERRTQSAFVADMWANFAPAARHAGKGAPDPRSLRWKA